MAFTNEDRTRMIQTETKVSTMHDAMFTEDGLSRCATHAIKIESVEKSLDKNGKWVKGIVIALSGSAFIFFLTILLNAATKAAP